MCGRNTKKGMSQCLFDLKGTRFFVFRGLAEAEEEQAAEEEV